MCRRCSPAPVRQRVDVPPSFAGARRQRVDVPQSFAGAVRQRVDVPPLFAGDGGWHLVVAEAARRRPWMARRCC